MFRPYAPAVFLVATVVGGALVPGPARAQPAQLTGGLPSAYVVVVPADPALAETAARVQSMARKALLEDASIDWTTADMLYVGYPPALLGRLAEGFRALELGRAAYLNLQLEEAVAQLEASIEALDDAAQALEGPEALGQALMFLGASQVALGQQRGARRTFQRLHIQMPHLRPDPQTFSPPVVAAYENARPQGASSPDGTIEIDATGGSAFAYVDFRPEGVTPVMAQGLVPGPHVVRVIRPGAAPAVERVEVRRGQRARVAATLSATPTGPALAAAVARLAQDSLGEELVDGEAPEQLANLLGVEVLTVVRVQPAGTQGGEVALELASYRLSSGRRIASSSTVTRTVPALLEAATGQLLADARAELGAVGQDRGEDIRGVGAVALRPDEDDDGSIFETWPFWTAVGVVVVAGAVTTAVLLQSDDAGEAPAGGQIILRF